MYKLPASRGTEVPASAGKKLDQLTEELGRAISRVADSAALVRTHVDSILGSLPESGSTMKGAEPPLGRLLINLEQVSALHETIDYLNSQINRLEAV